MDWLKSLLQGTPAIGGLLKGKDGGATTSEFTALSGLYAAVLTLPDCPGWAKATVLGVATVAYAWIRSKSKAQEAA